jgi:hypothetical protein
MKSLKCNTLIFSQIKIFKDNEQCKTLTRVLHCDLYLKGKMFYTTSFKCIIKNIHTSHANVNVNPKIYRTWSVKKLTHKYNLFTFTHTTLVLSKQNLTKQFSHMWRGFTEDQIPLNCLAFLNYHSFCKIPLLLHQAKHCYQRIMPWTLGFISLHPSFLKNYAFILHLVYA